MNRQFVGRSHLIKPMTWRERISGIYEARAERPGIASRPEFYPGASAEHTAFAQTRLSAIFPASLRTLLLETDGVMDMLAIDGGEWFESMWLLWSVQGIVDGNLSHRSMKRAGTYDRDFRELMFFADAGTDGILFGFPVMGDGVCAPCVVVWHPIEDDLDEVAPSLEDFLQGWLTGAITV
jgi:hypothetical protein